MFIDIGAQSKEEVMAWGIKPGDPVVPFSPYTPLHNEKMVMAKAWDDRFACAAGIEVLHALKEKTHPNAVYMVGTVQEEVGLRGAQTSSYVVDPDVGICLDVGFAGDYPGISERDALGKVGQGPMITIYDSSAIPNVKLRELVIATAEGCKIPYQYDYNPGGTDTGRIQLNRAGVPSINIGVPTRYQHSPFSVINLDDYDNTIRLVVEVIMRLDATTVASLVD